MRSLLFVCFVAFTLIVVAARTGITTHAQTLQKGISVQMVPTSNATPMPEADNEDAWIVAVTADGNLYFGIDPETPTSLVETMKSRPRNRRAKLYIKADARASFASVEKVLEIARAMEFETPVLLTAQAEHNAPGTIVPPKGVDVSIGSALPSGAIATVVQLLPSGNEPPLLINNDPTSWSALEGTLRRHFQKSDDRLVLLRADAGLPFAEVVRAIDSCRAAGARVALALPEL